MICEWISQIGRCVEAGTGMYDFGLTIYDFWDVSTRLGQDKALKADFSSGGFLKKACWTELDWLGLCWIFGGQVGFFGICGTDGKGVVVVPWASAPVRGRCAENFSCQ
jgi:hypothetical protein